LALGEAALPIHFSMLWIFEREMGGSAFILIFAPSYNIVPVPGFLFHSGIKQQWQPH